MSAAAAVVYLDRRGVTEQLFDCLQLLKVLLVDGSVAAAAPLSLRLLQGGRTHLRQLTYTQ